MLYFFIVGLFTSDMYIFCDNNHHICLISLGVSTHIIGSFISHIL